MLIKNANKIVLKLGSSTVVDNKGVFKKKWVTSLIKDIKKIRKGEKLRYCLFRSNCPWPKNILKLKEVKLNQK